MSSDEGILEKMAKGAAREDGGDGTGDKKKVLFLCTANSGRSQMAEGLLRALYGDRFEPYSAGTEPGGVHPLAIEAMRDAGIDITSHYSKSTDEFKGTEFDYVVTVCDHAKEYCPFFPGAKNYIHQSFTDPSSVEGTKEEQAEVFTRVRDEIKDWLKETFGKQKNSTTPFVFLL